MKLRFFSICAALGLVATASQAASTLMTMTFDAGGANIDEIAGWNGTTAPGGFLDPLLSVVSGMQILGTGFSGAGGANQFHVDGWNTTTGGTGYVGFTIGNGGNPLVNFSLSGETFSTRMHYHYTGGNASNIFDTVELLVNGISAGTQSFTASPTAQTLTWTMPAGLNGLTSAAFRLNFTGGTSPSGGNSGPEWNFPTDGAFVTFNGTVAPEPSRALLSMGGLLCLAIRRRRK